ncbi:MAG: response regulator [Ignavibacterium sp.]
MKNTVLLVDDDSTFNFLAETILKSSGFDGNIKICLNGKEAINFLQETDKTGTDYPSLILLDINMPIMNGFEFLDLYNNSELKIKHKTTIAVVTSSSDIKDKHKATEMGIEHFLNKPLAIKDIKTLIEDLKFSC